MDTAKQDYVGTRFCRLITKAQRVTDKVRGILQLRDLIIVRQYDSVPLALELLQLFSKIDSEIYTSTYHCLISRFLMNSQTSEARYRLGFIGAGKLGGSVIRGLVRARFCQPGEIIASEPSEAARAELRKDADVIFAAENGEAAEKAKTILIGVKPSIVLPTLREIRGRIDNKLVISLAAGVRISSMEKIAGARFMRALTNTPSAVCQAATATACGTRTTNADVDLVRKIFGAIGIVAEVADEQIDTVTALCGSGPAFIYAIIEALAAGAVKMGLDANVAVELAIQMVFGAAQFADESKLSLEELREMIVTPGGTTAAGLAEMEKLQTAKGLIAAVEAATKRGREMARENP